MTIAVTLTATVLFYYNPTEGAKHDAAQIQAKELAAQIEAYNAIDPTREFNSLDLSQLPGVDKDHITDQWGNSYVNNFAGGYVFSYGPNGPGSPESEWIKSYYRPASAEVVARTPDPGTTTRDNSASILCTWRLVGSARLVSSVMWVDNTSQTPVLTQIAVGNAAAIPTSSDVFDANATSKLWQAGAQATWQVSYRPPTPLAEGLHQIVVSVTDDRGTLAQANWSFKVDTLPPAIFALTPPNGGAFNDQSPPVGARYTDATGVDVNSVKLTINPDPWNNGQPHTYTTSDTSTDKAGALNSTHVRVDPAAVTYLAPAGGLPSDTVYAATLTAADTVGNTTGPVNWSWTLRRTIPPVVTILSPQANSTLTTADDIDPRRAGVQISVRGATEPTTSGALATDRPCVTLKVLYSGSGLPQQGTQADAACAPADGTQLTTRADANGNWFFPEVSLGSTAGATNAIMVIAAVQTRLTKQWLPDMTNASASARYWVTAPVYVFDRGHAVQIDSAYVTPQTTQPNQPVTFSMSASGGTTPYQYHWDFADTLSNQGLLETPHTTASVQHTYTTTGVFNAKVTLTDGRGLAVTTYVPVYVGQESQSPSATVNASPLEFRYTRPPGMIISGVNTQTGIQIHVSGHFLGKWRLKVFKQFGAPPLFPDAMKAIHGQEWWYNPANPSDDPTNAHAINSPSAWDNIWSPASSNAFQVTWRGFDNLLFGSHNSTGVTSIASLTPFEGNQVINPAKQWHWIGVEYQDAFGHSAIASAPVRMFNDIPTPPTMAILGPGGTFRNDPYAAIDLDGDGVWDYVKTQSVDLLIDTPSTAVENLWISNYPPDLGDLADDSGHLWSNASTIAHESPMGKVFQNWTTQDGAAPDYSDGSTGWVPLTFLSFQDWPLGAGAGDARLFPQAAYTHLRAPHPERAYIYFPLDPRLQKLASQAGSRLVNVGVIPSSVPATSGLSLGYDGPKTVWVIFKAAGPILSTELSGSNRSQFNTKGVTHAQIIVDTTGPLPGQSGFLDVLVQPDLSDLNRTQSVFGTLSVTAVDKPDTWGSGMKPRGQVVVSAPNRPIIAFPYSDTIQYNFGAVDQLPRTTVLTATLQWYDNLHNLSPVQQTVQVTVSKFIWTMIGSADTHVVDFGPQPSITILNTNLAQSGNPNLDAWRRGAPAVLPGTVDSFSPPPGTTTIDPAQVPDPQSRLGRVQARRPGSSEIDAEQAFPVDNAHKYWLVLIKDPVALDVEYQVFQTSLSIPDNTLPSDIVSRGQLVAQVGRVSDPTSPDGRVDEGFMILPTIVFSGDRPGLAQDLHTPPPPALAGNFDATAYFDQGEQLLMSQGATPARTFPYLGAIAFVRRTSPTASGTVSNQRYKVTANTFAVRVGFATGPGTDIQPASARFLLPTSSAFTLLKGQLVDPLGGEAPVRFTSQAVVDLPEDPATGLQPPVPLPSAMVQGERFRVMTSNYNKDFEMVTTGTVQAQVQLSYTYTSLLNPTQRTNVVYVTDNGSVQNNPAFFRLTDTRQQYGNVPYGIHRDVTWPLLADYQEQYNQNPNTADPTEGTLTCAITYLDDTGVIFHPTSQTGGVVPVYTATVDSRPPRAADNTWPKVQIHSGTYWAVRAQDSTVWTTGTTGIVAYDAQDIHGVWREMASQVNGRGPPVSPLTAGVGTSDDTTAMGNAAAQGGDYHRWYKIAQGQAVANAENITLEGLDGRKLFHFRFRDDFFNIVPPPTSLPDSGQGVTGTYISTAIYLDRVPPVINSLGWALSPNPSPFIDAFKSVNRLKILTASGSGMYWTNDPQPKFLYTITDQGTALSMASGAPSPYDTGSGLRGMNYALSTTGALPTHDIPPDIPQGSAWISNATSANFPALTYDGKWTFAIKGLDWAGQDSSLQTTTVNLDMTGPTINVTNLNLMVRTSSVTQLTYSTQPSPISTLYQTVTFKLPQQINVTALLFMSQRRNPCAVHLQNINVGSTQLYATPEVVIRDTAPAAFELGVRVSPYNILTDTVTWQARREPGVPTSVYIVTVFGYIAGGSPGLWMKASDVIGLASDGMHAPTNANVFDVQWNNVQDDLHNPTAPKIAVDPMPGVGVHPTLQDFTVSGAQPFLMRWGLLSNGQTSPTSIPYVNMGTSNTTVTTTVVVPGITPREFYLQARDRLTNVGPITALLLGYANDLIPPASVSSLYAATATSQIQLYWFDTDKFPAVGQSIIVTDCCYKVYENNCSLGSTFVSTLPLLTDDRGKDSPVPYCYYVPSFRGVTDGTWKFFVHPVDSAGNEQFQGNNTTSVLLDTTPPVVNRASLTNVSPSLPYAVHSTFITTNGGGRHVMILNDADPLNDPVATARTETWGVSLTTVSQIHFSVMDTPAVTRTLNVCAQTITDPGFPDSFRIRNVKLSNGGTITWTDAATNNVWVVVSEGAPYVTNPPVSSHVHADAVVFDYQDLQPNYDTTFRINVVGHGLLPDEPWTNDRQLMLTYSTSDLARFSKCALNTPGSGVASVALALGSSTATSRAATGTHTFTLTDADGRLDYTVQATDAVKYKSYVYSAQVNLDTTGPNLIAGSLGLQYGYSFTTAPVFVASNPATTGQTLPVTKRDSVYFTWNAIETAAVDPAPGVGVSSTLTDQTSSNAFPWSYTYTSTDSANNRSGVLTSAQQVYLPLSTSRVPLSTSILLIAPIDRLTNIGPYVKVSTILYDTLPPYPVKSLKYLTPTTQVSVSWVNPGDQGPAGTDHYNVYRSMTTGVIYPLIQKYDSRVALDSTTANTGWIGSPVKWISTLARDNTEDGLWKMGVAPVDLLGSENTTITTYAQVRLDTTTPEVTAVSWTTRPLDPVSAGRPFAVTVARLTTTANGIDWTNDTKVTAAWRSDDIARFSLVSPTDPGSGVKSAKPVLCETGTCLDPGTSFFSQGGLLSGNATQSYDMSGLDGLKIFSLRVVDNLAHYSARPSVGPVYASTSFMLDTTGPTLLPANLALQYRYDDGSTETALAFTQQKRNGSTTTFQTGILAAGQLFQADTTNATITSMPAFLSGVKWIKTFNADAGLSGANGTQFTLNNFATVFVGYVTSNTTSSCNPTWLSGYTDTGMTIATTVGTYHVFRRYLTAGSSLTIPQNLNGASGCTPPMYIVMLRGWLPFTYSSSSVDTLPITTAQHFSLAFAQVSAAANDGLGIGVDPDETTNTTPDWRYQFFSTVGSLQTTATTALPGFTIALAPATLSTSTLKLAALDRLTNIGPAVRILGVRRDVVPPVPVTSVTYVTPATLIHMSWPQSADVGPAGTAGYRIYRSQATGTLGSLEQTVPQTGATLAFNSGLTQPTNGCGTQDGTWYYTIQPYDNVNNEQFTGNVQSKVLMDTTTPTVDKVSWVFSQGSRMRLTTDGTQLDTIGPFNGVTSGTTVTQSFARTLNGVNQVTFALQNGFNGRTQKLKLTNVYLVRATGGNLLLDAGPTTLTVGGTATKTYTFSAVRATGVAYTPTNQSSSGQYAPFTIAAQYSNVGHSAEWSNETKPRYSWQSSDLARCSTVQLNSLGSGVKGTTFVLQPVSSPFAILSNFFSQPSLNAATATSTVVAAYSDGPWTLGVKAVDNLSLYSSVLTTTMWEDQTGPTVQSGSLGLRVSAYNPSAVTYTYTYGPWGTSSSGAIVHSSVRTYHAHLPGPTLVSQLKFTSTANKPTWRNIHLNLSGSQVAGFGGDLGDTRTVSMSWSGSNTHGSYGQQTFTIGNGSRSYVEVVNKLTFRATSASRNLNIRHIYLHNPSGTEQVVDATNLYTLNAATAEVTLPISPPLVSDNVTIDEQDFVSPGNTAYDVYVQGVQIRHDSDINDGTPTDNQFPQNKIQTIAVVPPLMADDVQFDAQDSQGGDNAAIELDVTGKAQNPTQTSVTLGPVFRSPGADMGGYHFADSGQESTAGIVAPLPQAMVVSSITFKAFQDDDPSHGVTDTYGNIGYFTAYYGGTGGTAVFTDNTTHSFNSAGSGTSWTYTPSSNVSVDTLKFSLQDQSGQTVANTAFQLKYSITVAGTVVTPYPAGTPVSAGGSLGSTSVATLLVSWADIESTVNDGKGVGVCNDTSRQAKQWNAVWGNGSSGTATDLTSSGLTLTMNGSAPWTMQLAAYDRLLNLGGLLNPTFSVTFNQPPVAHICVSQSPNPDDCSGFTVVNQAMVTFEGDNALATSSDPNGDSITYAWTLLATPPGSTATLSATNIAEPTLTPDIGGFYTVQLVVTDQYGLASAPVTATIRVHSRPVAVFSIAPSASSTNQQLTLDGSGSYSPIGDALTYSWSIASEPTSATVEVLSAPTSAITYITPLHHAPWQFQLVVNDGTMNSNANVQTDYINGWPCAAGTWTAVHGSGATTSTTGISTITLDGTPSTDPDRFPNATLTYWWSFKTHPGSSTATVSNAAAAKPTFVADKNGTYTFYLTVRDGRITSTNTATIDLGYINGRPRAAFNYAFTPSSYGETMETSGLSTFNFDATPSSDPENQTLSYYWAVQTNPVGATATLDNANAQKPNLGPDKRGTWTIGLNVHDTANAPSPTTPSKTIVVNGRPASGMNTNWSARFTAAVGETKMTSGLSTVNLLDASTDPDAGDTWTYAWWVVEPNPWNAAVTLGASTTNAPTFVPTRSTTYTVSVLVTDNHKAPAPATATALMYVNGRPYSVITQNAFTPSLGETAITTGISTINVAGTGSTDPDPGDQNNLTYAWTFFGADGTIGKTSTASAPTWVPSGAVPNNAAYTSAAITDSTTLAGSNSLNSNKTVAFGATYPIAFVRFAQVADPSNGLSRICFDLSQNGTWAPSQTLTSFPQVKLAVDSQVAWFASGTFPSETEYDGGGNTGVDFFGIGKPTQFAAEWVGQLLTGGTGGSFSFGTHADDGLDLNVNGTDVISGAWLDEGSGYHWATGSISLSANTKYPIVLKYFEHVYADGVALGWEPPGTSSYVLIPAANLIPAQSSVTIQNVRLYKSGALVASNTATMTLQGQGTAAQRTFNVAFKNVTADTVKFDFQDGGTYNKASFTVAALTPSSGTWNSTLVVKDPYKAPSGNTATVAFTVNQRPAGAISDLAYNASSFGETMITSGLSTINLDSSLSWDPDLGDSVASWRWTVLNPSGSIEAVSPNNNSTLAFVPAKSGIYSSELLVWDTHSAPAGVTVNHQVTVNGRPRSVITANTKTSSVGETAPTSGLSIVQFHQNGTDPDPGDTLLYTWTLTSPTGGLVPVSSATNAAPTFTPAVSGTYTSSLYVTDNHLAPSQTTPTNPFYINGRPYSVITQNAFTPTMGETMVTTGISTINLSGTGSTDPDFNESLSLTYVWTFNAPDGTSISSSTLSAPGFVPLGTATQTIVYQSANITDNVTSDSPGTTRTVTTSIGSATYLSDVQFTMAADTNPNGLFAEYRNLTGNSTWDSTICIRCWPLLVSHMDSTLAFYSGTFPSDASAADTVSLFPTPPPAANDWEYFGCRWDGQLLTGSSSGSYSFETKSDDGSDFNIYVGGSWQTPVSNDAVQAYTALSGSVTLSANTKYPIYVRYFQKQFNQGLHVAWTPPSGSKVIIPQANLIPPNPSITFSNAKLLLGNTVVASSSASKQLYGQDSATLRTWDVQFPLVKADKVVFQYQDQQTLAGGGNFSWAAFATRSTNTWSSTLTVKDKWLAPATNTPSLAITVNQRPSAGITDLAFNASSYGETMITSGLSTINLDSSTSWDPDAGDSVSSYIWRVVNPSGTVEVVSPNNNSTLAFIPAKSGIYTNQLMVYDTHSAPAGATANHKVTVNGRPRSAISALTYTQGSGENTQTANLSVIQLHNNSTDPDPGDTILYTWTVTDPTSNVVTLSSGSAAAPTFSPVVNGTFTASLYVTDNHLAPSQTTPTYQFYVNGRPTAVLNQTAFTASIGGETAPSENLSTLNFNGSGSSDPDSDGMTYNWTIKRPDGTTFSTPTGLNQSFVPTVGGTWNVSLVVKDTHLAPSVNTPAVDVFVNYRPLSVITARTFTASNGETLPTTTLSIVQLNQASTDTDNDTPYTYVWTSTGPTSNIDSLSDPTVQNPTFTPAVSGTHTATLVVYDSNHAPSSNTASYSYYINGRPKPVSSAISFTAEGGETMASDSLSLVKLNQASTDPDQGDTITYFWTLSDPSGNPVTVSSSTASAPTFTPATYGTFTSNLVVTDNHNAVSPITATNAFYINGRPTAVIAVSGFTAGATELAATEALSTVNLSGTGSTDPENEALTYAWTIKRPDNSTFSSPTASAPTFAPNVGGTWSISLVVKDTHKAPSYNTASTTYYVNFRPIATVTPSTFAASAGETAPTSGLSTVTLKEASSDPDNNLPLTYGWTVTDPSSTAVTLSSPTAENPTYVPAKSGTYSYTLRVTDTLVAPTLNPSSGSVYINGRPRPIINATSFTAGGGESLASELLSTVRLNQASTDPDAGDSITYAWTLTDPNSNPVTVSSSTASAPTFVPAIHGTFTATLTVTDNHNAVSPFTASRAFYVNGRPTATITVMGFTQGAIETAATESLSTVNVSGTASTDPENETLTYGWTFIRPNATVLGTSTASAPGFAPNVGGTWTVTLVVTDTHNARSLNTDSTTYYVHFRPIAGVTATTFTASQVETAPTSGMSTITLNDNSTDADGDTPLVYAWTVTDPSGTAVTLSSPTAQHPTFVPAKSATYNITLRVTDSLNAPCSSAASGTVYVNGRPRPGLAAETFVQGMAETAITSGISTVTLVQATTDPDPGDTWTYAWSVKDPSSTVVTLSSSTATAPTFIPAMSGTYNVVLAVTDNHLAPSPVTATHPLYVNGRPRAVQNTGAFTAMFTQTQGETYPTETISTVKLDGTVSTDPDLNALTYRWVVTDPSGNPVTVSSTTASQPTFVPAVGGSFQAVLTVTDSKNAVCPVVAQNTQTYVVNWRPVSAQSPVTSVSSSNNETKITSGLTTVRLHDNSTDPDNNTPFSYRWTVTDPNSALVTLTSSTTNSPTFIPALRQTYTIKVNAVDSRNAPSGSTATQTIIVNGRPYASEQAFGFIASVSYGETKQTSGLSTINVTSNSTDPDSDGLSYQWVAQRSSSGTDTVNNSTSQVANYVPTTSGTNTVVLTVTDTWKAPSPNSAQQKIYVNGRPRAVIDAITFSTSTGETAPTTPLDPVSGLGSCTVNLSNNGSTDPDGDARTYAWSCTDPNSSAITLTNPTAATATFTPVISGTHTAQLVLQDTWGAPAGTTPTKGFWVNARPTAIIAVTPTGSIGNLTTIIHLDATSSYDPDNSTPFTYKWILTEPSLSANPCVAPLDGSALLLDETSGLASTTSSKVKFTGTVAGNWVVQLVVKDSFHAVGPTASAVILVNKTAGSQYWKGAGAGYPKGSANGCPALITGTGVIVESQATKTGDANLYLLDSCAGHCDQNPGWHSSAPPQGSLAGVSLSDDNTTAYVGSMCNSNNANGQENCQSLYRVGAYTASAGGLSWYFNTGQIEMDGAVPAPSKTIAGRIYCIDRANKLYAVDPPVSGVTASSPAWSWNLTNAPAAGSPVVIQVNGVETVVITQNGSNGGNASFVQAPSSGSTGVTYWDFNVASRNVFSTPSVGPDGTVYVTVYDNGFGSGRLWALNPVNKTVDAYVTSGYNIKGGCVVDASNNIYFGISSCGLGCSTSLYAVNYNSGSRTFTTLWHWDSPESADNDAGDLRTTPVLASGGELYIGGGRHKDDHQGIWAFNIANGAPSAPDWHFDSGDSGLDDSGSGSGADAYNGDPTLGPDGLLYFQDGSNCYALYTNSPGLATGGWPKFMKDLGNRGR